MRPTSLPSSQPPAISASGRRPTVPLSHGPTARPLTHSIGKLYKYRPRTYRGVRPFRRIASRSAYLDGSRADPGSFISVVSTCSAVLRFLFEVVSQCRLDPHCEFKSASRPEAAADGAAMCPLVSLTAGDRKRVLESCCVFVVEKPRSCTQAPSGHTELQLAQAPPPQAAVDQSAPSPAETNPLFHSTSNNLRYLYTTKTPCVTCLSL